MIVGICAKDRISIKNKTKDQIKGQGELFSLSFFVLEKLTSLYTFQQAENSIEKSLPPILEDID